MKLDRYGLTKDGEAISVDAYCLSISKIPSTYVTLLQDRDDFGTVTDQNIDWSSPFNELTYGSDPLNTQEFCDAIENVINDGGDISGQYSYLDENGNTIVVKYSAGVNGFRYRTFYILLSIP